MSHTHQFRTFDLTVGYFYRHTVEAIVSEPKQVNRILPRSKFEGIDVTVMHERKKAKCPVRKRTQSESVHFRLPPKEWF